MALLSFESEQSVWFLEVFDGTDDSTLQNPAP